MRGQWRAALAAGMLVAAGACVWWWLLQTLPAREAWPLCMLAPAYREAAMRGGINGSDRLNSNEAVMERILAQAPDRKSGENAGGIAVAPSWLDPAAMATTKAACRPVALVAALSAPTHELQRQAVRETWFNYSTMAGTACGAGCRCAGMHAFVAVFAVALAGDKVVDARVRSEAAHYNDMLVLDYIDQYRLVALKTVALFAMAEQLGLAYAIKTDEDSFVDVAALLKALAVMPPHRLYWGYTVARPFFPVRQGFPRGKNEKYAVSQSEWPDACVTGGPRYVTGALMVLSRDVFRAALALLRACVLAQQPAAWVAPGGCFFPMEDVFVGLVLAHMGLSPTPMATGQALVHSDCQHARPPTRVLVVNSVSVDNMYRMFANVHSRHQNACHGLGATGPIVGD